MQYADNLDSVMPPISIPIRDSELTIRIRLLRMSSATTTDNICANVCFGATHTSTRDILLGSLALTLRGLQRRRPQEQQQHGRPQQRLIRTRRPNSVVSTYISFCFLFPKGVRMTDCVKQLILY